MYTTSAEQVRNKHNDLRQAIENVCGFLVIEENDCVVFLAAGLKTSAKDVGTWVNAIHIIVPSKIYESGQHLLNEINAYDDWSIVVDRNIYRKAGKRGMLRMPYMKKIRSTDDRVYKLVNVSTLAEYELEDALKVSNPYDWFASRCVVVPVAVVDEVNTTVNQYWVMFVNVFPRTAEDFMFCKETV